MATTSTVGVKGIAATYYLAKDLDRETEFYTKLLGFAPTMAMPDMVSEWTFPTGESFGLYRPHDLNEWHPSGGVMFEVESIHGSMDAAKAIGAEFGEHVEDTPVCFMGFGKDPDGNSFMLHQAKKG